MKLLVGFPEYKVPLPGGIRASQSDIFLLAKGNNQLASITVEGKVSETFGPTIEEWITDYGKGKEKRLKYLCGVLGLEEGIMTHIRYQLVHRTASAVIEAKEFNAHTAMMLVHSFSSENQGFEDYKDFLNLFNIKGEIDRLLFAKNIDGIDLFFCWVKDNLNFALRPGTSFLEELVAAEEKYGALAGKLAKLPPQKP